MQSPTDYPAGGPYPQTSAQMPHPEKRPKRGLRCLVWIMAALFLCALATGIVLVAGFLGWNEGISIARATIAAEVQVQCEEAHRDLEDGNARLLQTRIEFLREQSPAPPCLSEIIAAAAALDTGPTASPRPSPPPAATALPTSPPTSVPAIPATAAPPTSVGFDYDLPALLQEAQADIAAKNYARAIDTLEAVIALDKNFRNDQVRGMLFAALTSQAKVLFQSGKLSEGIVTTARAEQYGDVGELAHERFVAESYLNGLRLKVVNPGESVRLLSAIVYQYSSENYLNGRVLTELQEAHSNYGDAFAYQGDPCSAANQYEAALDLRPRTSSIRRGRVAELRDRASADCRAIPTVPAIQADADSAAVFSTPVGPPTQAPIGYRGG